MPDEFSDGIAFPDGTLLQWGQITFPANSQGYNIIHFNRPFMDSNYSVVATPVYANPSVVTFEVSADNRDEEYCTVYGRYNGSPVSGAYAKWIAIGKWK